jgi:hypothetical protein
VVVQRQPAIGKSDRLERRLHERDTGSHLTSPHRPAATVGSQLTAVQIACDSEGGRRSDGSVLSAALVDNTQYNPGCGKQNRQQYQTDNEWRHAPHCNRWAGSLGVEKLRPRGSPYCRPDAKHNGRTRDNPKQMAQRASESLHARHCTRSVCKLRSRASQPFCFHSLAPLLSPLPAAWGECHQGHRRLTRNRVG